MAEFEELRINVKTEPEKASENARQLQDAFRQIGGTQQTEQFEKLGRQLKLTEKQIKDLGEALGKPQSTLQAFATGFGKAGMIMGAFGVAIKAAQMAADQFNKVAGAHLEIQNQANRMGGIHAAQLNEDIRAMERNSIERSRSMSMIEKFNEKMLDFKDKTTGFRRSILEDVQGPFVDVVEKHFAELRKAPNLEEQMNAVRRFASEIEKYYTARGDAPRGAQERRKYLEKWFGLPDIMQMNEDFKQVSEDTKKEWDEQQQVLTEYVRVTTEISDNWEKILSGIVHATLEDLGINKGLVMLNDLLERGAREHTDLGAMTAEQRKEYSDKLRAAGDKYWREHGIVDFLKHLWEDPDFAKKLVPPPPIEKEGHATHLLENYNDNASDLVLESKRLTQNIGFLNSLLSGETSSVGGGDARSKFATMFHNRPQGGAEGESNPIKLPASVSQPGGGAAVEARDAPSRSVTSFAKGGERSIMQHDYAATLVENLSGLRAYNTGDKAKLRQFMASGGQGMNAADVAWCASTVRSAYTQAGMKGSLGGTNALASSFFNWQKEVKPEDIQRGDVVTLPPIKGFRSGHVGVATGPFDPETKSIPYASGNTALGDKWVPGGAAAVKNLPVGGTGTNRLYSARRDVPRISLHSPGPATRSPLAMGPEPQEGMGMDRGGRDFGVAAGMQRLGIGEEETVPTGSNSVKTHDWLKQIESGMEQGRGEAGIYPERPHSAALNAGRGQVDRMLSDQIDVSGKLNVKVDAPAGTSVRAKGGGMFEKGVTVDRGIQANAGI